MTFELRGRALYIDRYGRLMCGTTDKIPYEIYKDLKGINPVKKNGFMLNLKYAKIFAPTMTHDPNELLGKDIIAQCSIKVYTINKETPGWTIQVSMVSVT